MRFDTIFDKPGSQCKSNTEDENESCNCPYPEFFYPLFPDGKSEPTDSYGTTDDRNITDEIYVLDWHPYIHLGPKIGSSKDREKQEKESKKSKYSKHTIGNESKTGDDEDEGRELDREGETDDESSETYEYIKLILFELFS